MNTTPNSTSSIGHKGEDLACEYLVGKGYAIVGRNMVMGSVEIDILTQRGNRLTIVEVKTRKWDHEDRNFALDRAKINRLCRAGAAYLQRNNLPHELQIDAIVIVNNPDGSQTLDHLADIALPPMRRRR